LPAIYFLRPTARVDSYGGDIFGVSSILVGVGVRI